jgi:hypothetical protein
VIKHVQLFGERCSGTNFVTSLIEKNFAGIALTKAFGGKHWFIKDHYPRCRPNESTDYQCVRPLGNSSDTLFICLFRNPYDWIRSINASPYHAADHWGLSLSEFIRKPWRSFETTRLNPCWPRRNDNYWFIEEAENVLRLRSRKIEHLLNLSYRVANVCYVNYESVVKNNDLVREIADHYQIKLRHSVVLGETKHLGSAHEREFKPRQYDPIDARDLAFIHEELDWVVERRAGYSYSSFQT